MNKRQAMGEETAALLATVVIRSYNRIDACIELLRILLRQDYRPYEIIVVDQSTINTEAQSLELERLSAAHDNLKILNFPPLGPAGARNKGWQFAKGDIVVFCDDDDLPLDTSWLSNHMTNYADPDIVGVSGREILTLDEKCGYANIERAKRMCLSYDLLGYPNVYCRLDERVERVDWLHGGNASARRSIIAAVGGWYEKMNDHEEHSFAFKLRKQMTSHQRLVFDPKPCVLRRKNISGGLDRQKQSPRSIYCEWFLYLHMIIGRYRPVRFVALYPAYLIWLLGISVYRTWKLPMREKDTLPEKFLLTIHTLFASPLWYMESWFYMLKKKT